MIAGLVYLPNLKTLLVLDLVSNSILKFDQEAKKVVPYSQNLGPLGDSGFFFVSKDLKTLYVHGSSTDNILIFGKISTDCCQLLAQVKVDRRVLRAISMDSEAGGAILSVSWCYYSPQNQRIFDHFSVDQSSVYSLNLNYTLFQSSTRKVIKSKKISLIPFLPSKNYATCNNDISTVKNFIIFQSWSQTKQTITIFKVHKELGFKITLCQKHEMNNGCWSRIQCSIIGTKIVILGNERSLGGNNLQFLSFDQNSQFFENFGKINIGGSNQNMTLIRSGDHFIALENDNKVIWKLGFDLSKLQKNGIFGKLRMLSFL